MFKHRRHVLLIQLPIPQPGLEPAKANVPLAAGYLKLHARNAGLEEQYEIDILPTPLANTLGDQALVAEILDRDPWLVGFTCYLWNIDRTLWISERLKERRPELRIIIGGPEVTADNAWVLDHPAVDFAAIGEGEQTFAELLAALIHHDAPAATIAGLHVAGGPIPTFRQPLPSLDLISSPYLAGILDAADEQLLLLETIRGCIFKCKFCYYPKSYDDLYFLSREKTIANLRHAAECGAREVVLLDPTLNQRKDFAGFVRLLAECNPDRQFTYFGELRAEGITPDIARLLRDANFTEVEIGLQSVDPVAQELMDRTNNLRAFERGVRALRDSEI
ncbi:MAG: cobalamin B12-binding domain-containing protein, partial [Planctomycetales bacterium]|nr:cobalamin B12-binding domain-containing protein [Planctomycetales bacterium]